MSRLIHMTAAASLAAFAAACLVGLASAAPQSGSSDNPICQKKLCLVALF